MFRNYLKIAWRNLTKHKLYSFINIAGLSIGVTCSIIIFLFISNELNFDTFHRGSENMYRAVRHGKFGDNKFDFAVTPAPLARALREEIPEVEKVARMRATGNWLIKASHMENSFKEQRLIWADSGFFDFFTFKIIEKNSESPLAGPNQITMSQSMAQKYFPDESAIGKTLLLDGEMDFMVTAVFQDMPKNSHIQYDFVMSMATIDDRANNPSFISNNFYTYFSIRGDADPDLIEEKINKMVDKYVSPNIEQNLGKTLAEVEADGGYYYVETVPMEEVYLNSDFTWDVGRMGNKNYVYLFGAIAVFIIILACINFMNLSTARSANRAKEVGIRKALGSFKLHLVNQFLIESILISLFSFVIGLLLVSLLLPFFNDLADKNLSIPFTDPVFLLVILISSVGVGVLAGLYPAFYLSSFRPMEVLKGKLSLGSGNGLIRSGLVIFQFCISIILIIGTIAIYKQLYFIQNRNIGFNKDQVIIIQDTYMLGDKAEAFKAEIENIPDVSAASYSGYLPVSGYARSEWTITEEGKQQNPKNSVSMQVWNVDNDYLNTLGMELISGRKVNKDLASDSNAVILNETAMQRFGLTLENSEPIVQHEKIDAKTLQVVPGEYVKYRVIGVVRDFNFESMKDEVAPLMFQNEFTPQLLSIRANTVDLPLLASEIKKTWSKFDSTLPFNYDFLDDQFGNMYRAEMQLAKMFSIFSGLAIFIGCLGLFALASFMAEQRTKEIGIRKVMGASVKSIVMMLSKQFSKLVVFSFIIAAPIAWYGISYWLESYSYRISLGWEVFMIAGVSASLIAWLTVAYHSIKAAVSNPVNSLKSE